MRKHFLILMLMALLPLAGWADPVAPVEYTVVTVTLGAFNKTYDSHAAGALPQVTVNGKKGGADAANLTSGQDYDLVWKNPAGVVIENADDVVGAGNYTVTVVPHTAGDTFTPAPGKSLTQTFTVNKRRLDVKAENVTITYGDEIPAVANFYSIYEENGYGFVVGDNEANSGVPVSLPNTITNDGVKTVLYTLTGNELVNYSVNFVQSQATFAVTAKSITITPAVAEGTYTYGTAIPANTFSSIFSDDFAFDETAASFGTPSYLFYKYASFDADELPENAPALTQITDAGKYQVVVDPQSLTAATSANYNVNYATAVFVYNQKELDANMITIKDGENNWNVTYNKVNHMPTVVVADGDYTLSSATDYELSFANTNGDITAASYGTAFTNADTYTVTVNLLATGNYKNPAAGNVAVNFIIKRKPVSLRTTGTPQTYAKTVYTSEAAPVNPDNKFRLTTKDNLLWDGVEAGDLNANNILSNLGAANITLELYKGAVSETNKVADDKVLNAYTTPGYTVYAKISGVVALANGAYPMGNYEVTVGNIGKIKVAKKVVTITAKNIEGVPYGTLDKYVEATPVTGVPDPGIENPTEEQIAAAINAAADEHLFIGTVNEEGDDIEEGTGLAGDDTYASVFAPDNLVSLQREEGNDVNLAGYDLNVILPEYTFDNYEFVEGDAAKYIIVGVGGVQVWANPATSKYKATRDDLTAEIVGVDADWTVDLQNAVNAALYVDVDGDNTDDDNVTTAGAGQYTIKFDATKLAEAFAGLTNYNLGTEENPIANIAQYTATYTVTPAPVKVKALPQVRMVGETVYTEKNNQTIGFEAVEENVIPTGEEITDIYAALTLKFGESLNAYLNEGALLETALHHGTAAAGDAVKGVYHEGVTLDGAAAYNEAAGKNFTLTVVPGQLTVTTDGVVTLLGNKADNSTVALVEGGAYAGKRLNVTIDKIGVPEFKAKTWYALSLPFAIKPFDFCSAVGGYAIFDRLSQSGDALSFKITMEEIPAYTPFLVKFDKATKISTVIFNKVSVEAAKIVDTEANEAWKFVNTVDFKNYTGYVMWLDENTTGGISTQWNYDTTTGTPMRGFRGIITTVSGEQPAARPVIYIEEADGSTTAISTITADGVALKAEGWYTLNGVKLQGMPTEKGVYINNGKKVVVK